PDAPIAAGNLKVWQDSGRTLKFIQHPLLYRGVAWIAHKQAPHAPAFAEETKLYPADVGSQIYSATYSKFVADAHEVFLKVGEMDPVSGGAPVAAPSATYFSTYARMFVQLLRAACRSMPDLDGLVDATGLAECVFAVHFVHPDQHRAESVMEWVNRSDPQPTQDETRDIMTTQVPHDHPGYWGFVQKLAMRGLFVQCASSLEQGGVSAADPAAAKAVAAAARVLRAAPRGPGFEQQHRRWRSEVLALADTVAAVADARVRRGLTGFADILRGDTKTILAVAETWQEAVGALLLLHDPAPGRIEEYFAAATEALPVDETLVWESGCAAAMAGDIARALARAEELDVCVAAHLADFCDRQGLLDDFFDEAALNLPTFRDWLMLKHGENCCSNPATYFVGVDYLQDTDCADGVAMICKTITAVPLTAQDTVTRLLAICRELGLADAYDVICTTWSRRQLQAGDVGGALVSLDAAGKAPQIRAVVWDLLEEGLVYGAAEPDAVLGAMLAAPDACPPLVRECLAPYAVFHEFVAARADGRAAEAGHLLASLVQFPYMPPAIVGLFVGEWLTLLDKTCAAAVAVDDLVATLNVLYVWQKDSLGACRATIDRALGAARDGLVTDPADWRLRFADRVASPDDLIKTFRIAAAHKIARAFLD
ncbi:nucleoporin Nup85-like protein, partial [Dipodascopsis tothii]|uniref:nucleoporin Nup85-like protein n=1 Tax=Dipodascopsis tothii TaxID=44089 RepID=UPI0034CE7569